MQFAEALDEAAGWLGSRHRGEVCVLAIDGHSAAGKSTFADALASRTGGALVRGDDFYRVMDETERARLAPLEGIELYYDWQRMRDEVLLPIRAGKPAKYHPYEWESGRLASRSVTIPAAPVLIIEGLFVSRPELQPLLDRSILVDASAGARSRRQSERADASQSGSSAGMRRSGSSSKAFARPGPSTSSFGGVRTSAPPLVGVLPPFPCLTRLVAICMRRHPGRARARPITQHHRGSARCVALLALRRVGSREGFLGRGRCRVVRQVVVVARRQRLVGERAARTAIAAMRAIVRE